MRAEPAQLTVLPLPEEGKPADFTRRGRQLRFHARRAKPTELDAGDPVTLRMEISGTGNLANVAAPPGAGRRPLPRLRRAAGEGRGWRRPPRLRAGGDPEARRRPRAARRCASASSIPTRAPTARSPRGRCRSRCARRARRSRRWSTPTQPAAPTPARRRSRSGATSSTSRTRRACSQRARPRALSARPGSWLLQLRAGGAVRRRCGRTRAGAIASRRIRVWCASARPDARRGARWRLCACAAAGDARFYDELSPRWRRISAPSSTCRPARSSANACWQRLAGNGCGAEMRERTSARFFELVEHARYAPSRSAPAERGDGARLGRRASSTASSASAVSSAASLPRSPSRCCCARRSLATAVRADEAAPQTAFFQGNQAYAAGHYDDAIHAYEPCATPASGEWRAGLQPRQRASSRTASSAARDRQLRARARACCRAIRTSRESGVRARARHIRRRARPSGSGCRLRSPPAPPRSELATCSRSCGGILVLLVARLLSPRAAVALVAPPPPVAVIASSGRQPRGTRDRRRSGGRRGRRRAGRHAGALRAVGERDGAFPAAPGSGRVRHRRARRLAPGAPAPTAAAAGSRRRRWNASTESPGNPRNPWFVTAPGSPRAASSPPAIASMML